MEALEQRTRMTGTLSKAEITRLERGLPRLSEWSEAIFATLPVRRLRHVDVVWINRRWFLERGVNVLDDDTLSRVQKWLVETFAYICPSDTLDNTIFGSETKVAYADRYGSSSGAAPHGGSGRAAVYGCFQAKGVGVTPLVGAAASLGHSHGCASLEEGIREAIYSEIAAAEFPYGAVPMIALLDTGLYFTSPDPEDLLHHNARRAILVRPAVLRPAHAERAALFKCTVKGESASQTLDVERARDVVRRWSRCGIGAQMNNPPDLGEALVRVAEQAAFGQVHRLFNGGYFSSNLSVTGELLDFGNMHVLPDWCNAKVLAHAAGFGNELASIEVLARSLHLYFKKYGDPATDHAAIEHYLAKISSRFREVFSRECLRLWGASDLACTQEGEEIAQAMRLYFSAQQRQRRRYEYGRVTTTSPASASNTWIHAAMLAWDGAEGPLDNSPANQALSTVLRLLRQAFGASSDAEHRLWLSWVTALRLLRPRQAADRRAVLQRIGNLMVRFKSGSEVPATDVELLIQDVVSQGRAHWPRLPMGLAVLACVTRGGSSALLCAKGPDGPRELWVEGISMGEHIVIFETRVLQQHLQSYAPCMMDGYCSVLIPETALETESGRYILQAGTQQIRIPELTHIF